MGGCKMKHATRMILEGQRSIFWMVPKKNDFEKWFSDTYSTSKIISQGWGDNFHVGMAWLNNPNYHLKSYRLDDSIQPAPNMPRSSSSSSSINTMLTTELSWLHPNPTDLRSRAKKGTFFDHKTSGLKEIYCRELNNLKNSSFFHSSTPIFVATNGYHYSLHLGGKFPLMAEMI